MIGKYARRAVEMIMKKEDKHSQIDASFLKEKGFM